MLPSNGMERVSRLIARMRLGETITPEDLALHAWPGAVGKKIAGRTRASRLFGSTLVVEVDDAVWERQLSALVRQILSNLEKSIGPGVVARIEYRVRPPRRGVRPAGLSDESDQIEDPILRGIYRASRKKALA
jgi:hypothetical protein